MIFLSGADIVLPDRIITGGTLVVDAGKISEIVDRQRPSDARAERHDLHNHLIVPGFIDVHVHGVDGVDTLDSHDAVRRIAARLPRYGVAAFCPTSLACGPDVLGRMLAGVRDARTSPSPSSARVLPAHLESNFINPEYAGAQPVECLRRPPRPRTESNPVEPTRTSSNPSEFSAADILAEIDSARPDVGIVTLAPELDGGLDLIRRLVAAGHRVSLGHSGATFDEARAGIDAGARHATHLFNRMPPMSHRAPGLAGAALDADEIAAELICDGVHVHPAVMRFAIAAKGAPRVMAITDATAGAGLPTGSHASIGGRRITVRETAYLDDGTIAGSVLTMDRAFERLVGRVGLSPVDAAILCGTTPARELGLHGHGVIAPGAIADLTVLDRTYKVAQTWIGGVLVYDGRSKEITGTVEPWTREPV
jgi:N-acetylglucosamine-6-phosphate deacetylase